MKRRTFLAGIALPLALPRAGAQPAVARVAWLSSASATGTAATIDALRRGLGERGYVEGRNLRLVPFWADNSDERTVELVAEVARLQPDVVVTQGPVVFALVKASPATRVVFGFSGDPVEAGLVQSLARPGGNATGMTFMSLDLVGKRMGVLREVLPKMQRAMILANPQHAGVKSELRASREAAGRLGVTLDYAEYRTASDVDDAYASAARSHCDAAIVFSDARAMRYTERIADLAVRTRIPTISGWAEFARGGNLFSYGPNLLDCYARLASHVDRVLKGAKPADIPVELPSRVEFVVNLRAAKALGVSVPQALLVRADEVIA